MATADVLVKNGLASVNRTIQCQGRFVLIPALTFHRDIYTSWQTQAMFEFLPLQPLSH